MRSQAWQVPAQAELQQTPSAQLPDWHWVPAAQASLRFLKQAPLPLQWSVSPKMPSVHSPSGSLLAVTLAQVPVVPPVLALVQAWQVPVQAELQQTPSAHLPDWHSVPAAQAVPLDSLGRQLLVVRSQKWVLVQSEPLVQPPGHVAEEPLHWRGAHCPGAPAGRSVQVPLAEAPRATLQALQPPEQGASQQTPSTQLPEVHSLAAEQAVPSVFLAVQEKPLQ